jgi:hypothetical protein
MQRMFAELAALTARSPGLPAPEDVRANIIFVPPS